MGGALRNSSTRCADTLKGGDDGAPKFLHGGGGPQSSGFLDPQGLSPLRARAGPQLPRRALRRRLRAPLTRGRRAAGGKLPAGPPS